MKIKICKRAPNSCPPTWCALSWVLNCLVVFQNVFSFEPFRKISLKFTSTPALIQTEKGQRWVWKQGWWVCILVVNVNMAFLTKHASDNYSMKKDIIIAFREHGGDWSRWTKLHPNPLAALIPAEIDVKRSAHTGGHESSTWCSDMKRGDEAWTGSEDMCVHRKRRHEAGTGSEDIKRGHRACTGNEDKKHGQDAGT